MNKQKGTFILSSLVLLALWQILSMVVASPVLVPSVFEIVKSAWSIIKTPTFLLNLGYTFLRGLESFALIFVIASVLGLLSYTYPLVRKLLAPMLLLTKAVPVMSIILLAFIWFTASAVPVFSAFLMGFPIMYTQVLSGLEALDPQLEQMCKVYGITGKRRIKYFVIPSMEPYIITASRQTLSIIWKVVIASEVLTVPRFGVGSRIQLSQVQLETSKVLAWTLAAVFLTSLSDHFFTQLIKRKVKWK